MNYRMSVYLLVGLLSAATCALGGCQQPEETPGASAVQTGPKADSSGQPVPPMAEQRRNKEGN